MFNRHLTRRALNASSLALVTAHSLPLGPAATGRGATARTGTPAATPVNEAVDRLDFTVDLGDFVTAARVSFPAGQAGPFPTVVLIPGSGAADMDFTLTDFTTGRVISTIFLDIAEYLAARGYAVVRYNKHYVESATDPQSIQTFYANFTLQMLLDDAASVYQAARALPPVDPERMVLYGWSEGSIIAVQLALAEPAAAGLILQGAVDASFHAVFAYQSRQLAVSFLTEVADTDQDGKVSFDDLVAAYEAHPGTVGGFAFLVSLDPASTLAAPKLNAAIDQDADGLLDIEAEVIPYLDSFFASFDAETAAGRSPYGPQYGSDQQLPEVSDAIVALELPILLLHGENDANVPAVASERIDSALVAANHPDHTLVLYPGLGHSLGPAETVYDDFFAPIATEPLADVLTWLDEHVGDGATANPTA